MNQSNNLTIQHLNALKLQQFNTSAFQQFNNLTIQQFNKAKLQQSNDSTIQQFNNQTIKLSNNSTIQQFTNFNQAKDLAQKACTLRAELVHLVHPYSCSFMPCISRKKIGLCSAYKSF